MENDRRKYLRIKTNLKALLKKVSKDVTSTSVRIFSTDLFKSDFEYKDMGIPEGLCLYLQYIDRKLDQILSLMSREIIEKEFPIVGEVVELGGGGIRCFVDTHELQINDKVEIILFLSHIPLYLLSCLGMITRVEEKENGNLLIIEFEYIKERDQDAIVRFIFQEQRDQIRAKKDA